MSTTLEKILANPELYQYDVPKLGDCKIASPVRQNEFIGEKDRILVTENTSIVRYLAEKLGHEPSFERAGPHAKIYHDPNWTRVGILTAGGLCPGLNNVIKGLVEILAFDYGIKTIFGIRFGCGSKSGNSGNGGFDRGSFRSIIAGRSTSRKGQRPAEKKG